MERIKEKPTGAAAIREKGKHLPRQLAERSAKAGAERLRTQLRDAAERGQRDEYGGDQIEDAAVSAAARAGQGLERTAQEGTKLVRAAGKRSGFTSAEENPKADTAPAQKGTGQDSALRSPEAQEPVIKTKEHCIREQAGTEITRLPEERAQGSRAFIREQGRQAAQQPASVDTAVSSRAPVPGSLPEEQFRQLPGNTVPGPPGPAGRRRAVNQAQGLPGISLARPGESRGGIPTRYGQGSVEAASPDKAVPGPCPGRKGLRRYKRLRFRRER